MLQNHYADDSSLQFYSIEQQLSSCSQLRGSDERLFLEQSLAQSHLIVAAGPFTFSSIRTLDTEWWMDGEAALPLMGFQFGAVLRKSGAQRQAEQVFQSN